MTFLIVLWIAFLAFVLGPPRRISDDDDPFDW